jgi:hypothetical protein
LAQQLIEEKRIKNILYYMKRRCSNKNRKEFKYYGKRGISVCEEWKNDTQKFVKWALNNGYEKELQIDRIDNNGNYNPENCRWVTKTQNLQNKRTSTTDRKNKTRICSKCREVKTFDSFSKCRNKSCGIRYICKNCDTNRKMEYRRRIRKYT